MTRKTQFDIALSFAGEDRNYVERVANLLADMGLRVFYDKHEAVTLWGQDLYTHLQDVYSKRARYTVMFISRHYKRKLWTNHERRSAQARAFRERREYILPARFDNTQLPGILDTTGYVDLAEVSPREFARLVKEKLGPIERPNFFPENPDRVYKHLKPGSDVQRERILVVMAKLFETMKLMTTRERDILAHASMNCCHAELPKNLHIEVEYLERLAKTSSEEILASFARLECLGITARLRATRKYEREPGALGATHTLEFKFDSNLRVPRGLDNRVLSAVFQCFDELDCKLCIKQAVQKLDWSLLSSRTAMPSRHSSRGKLSPN